MVKNLVALFQAVFVVIVAGCILLAFSAALSMFVEIFTGYDFIRDTSRPFFEEMMR
jgi:hypothetical protein